MLTSCGAPVPQKVVVRVDAGPSGSAREGVVDRAPEAGVVDGQVVAAVEDDDVGGVAAQLLGGDLGGPRALAVGVLEPAAGHGAEDAGAPHAGEHHEGDATSATTQRRRRYITRPRASNMASPVLPSVTTVNGVC